MDRDRRRRRAALYFQLNARYLRYLTVALCFSGMVHWLGLIFAPAPQAKPVVLAPLPPTEVVSVNSWEPLPPPKPVPRPPLPPEASPPDGDEPVELTPNEAPEPEWSPPPPSRPSPSQPPAPILGFEKPPVVIRAVEPDYPSLARDAGAEGRVDVLVTINAQGRVVAAELLATTAPASLVDAALAAARQFLFRPAIQHQRPVASRVAIPFVFTLH